MLLKKLNEFLPLKKRKISSEYQPFCNEKMKRLNPDKILDNIVTDMSKWYQKPKCLPALVRSSNCCNGTNFSFK